MTLGTAPGTAPGPATPRSAPVPFTAYQRRLFVFLGVATFFEGYDFYTLTQVLPSLRTEFDLSRAAAGQLVAFINLGTVLAYLLIGRADRWGRRRVLVITIAGYTVFTLLTGLATGLTSFAVFQLLARLFLIAEWATSMVYAAEEFPAERRGMVIGVIQAFSSLGAICCAAIMPLLLQTPWGWRTAYLVGGIPLVILAFARRNLRETTRFEHAVHDAKRSVLAIFRTAYRGRVLLVGAAWLLTYVCTGNAITFFKEFAVGERGMTDAQVAVSTSVAAVLAMPLVFAAGKLIDVLGRKGGATVIYVLGAAGTVGCYSLHAPWAITASLVLGIFFASGTLPVLNAYTTELFPTELRADAFAWCNNLIGRSALVLSPWAVGAAAERVGWGPAISATAVFPLVALLLIVLVFPETRARDLDDTARMTAQ